MSISKYPSKLSLPQIDPGVSSVLEYLIIRFPDIDPKVWQARVADGKVHWHDGSLITADSPYQAQQRVYYYREVENEVSIPFKEKILFQDEHILVAHKPHFLTVTPGGIYINECLQNRLRVRTGLEDLQTLHRLDRATAGLVLFSVNPETRHLYHQLFQTRKIHKTYQAIARVNNKQAIVGQQWIVKNRIEKSKRSFLMEVVEGKPNSHSVIRCLQQSTDKALFELNPITGKKHQLRLHMQTLGWPLLHDKYYPTLQPETIDVYASPLQLLAKELRFIDPVTQLPRIFNSNTDLRLE
ncbi:MAG: pseudouridine synthase [Gammaproteobacteria bacterium]|nr:pseudouridine synthase [Gammaproteobacteria bacterium]